MKALLVVDVQNDFCPGGALGAPEGDTIIPIINALAGKFDLVVASKDWHPAATEHFKKWPVHCVRDTPGADFHPLLNREMLDEVFLKGTGTADDGYSAFEATNKDLEGYLREMQVNDLYVCGLATDYCVKASALDAKKRGLEVFVVADAIKGVDVRQGDVIRAMDEMKREGVIFLTAGEVPPR